MAKAPTPQTWQALIPDLLPFISGDEERHAEVQQAVATADRPKDYLPWRKFKYHQPILAGWSHEKLWALVKLQRFGQRRVFPGLLDKEGKPFSLVQSDPMFASLQRIDTRETVWDQLLGKGTVPKVDNTYRLRAAIEEAHHSSAIEGAVTTRRQARELIRSGREPRNRSEKMVLNNYRTIEQLDEWAEQPLTPGLLCAMQRSITEDTLDKEADYGAFRTDDDVYIVDASSGEAVFHPPTHTELADRVKRLCLFANQDDPDRFVHPVVKGALLHHQLAYDHPFGDGNGRTARTLFLWSLLRSGYWWFRSLSVSRAVNNSRSKYYQAFVDVQEDESDVTYFVRQQLRCVEKEIEHLAGFLKRRARLAEQTRKKRIVSSDLNRRQLAALESAIKDQEAEFTIAGHASYHGVTYPSAWNDLTRMEEMRLLSREKRGRKAVFRPTKVIDALRGAADP